METALLINIVLFLLVVGLGILAARRLLRWRQST